MEPSPHLYLLGAPRAEVAGHPIRGFESRKAFALLGYLACHNTAIPRTELAALFWPDLSDERARSNLRGLLHNLTTVLPNALVVDRRTVSLVVAPACWTDVTEFERHAAQNTLTSLAAAADLYRSAFLDGLYLDDCPDVETWLTQQREHWHERAAHVLTGLTARAHERQEWAAALHSVDRLLTLDPWREAAHQDKMRLLALSGQRDTALAHYEICRRVLADELGIDPLPETTALYEQIRDGLLAPLPPAQQPHRHVPLPPTPLLGRAAERAWVIRQLVQPVPRLITLVGTGGIGKTCLALDIVANLHDSFAEIVFVDLTLVSDAGHVVPAIARSLAVRETDDQLLLDSVKTYLYDRHVLLLLDNFEHVIAAAPQIADLLAGCPMLKVLVTSREELHLRGEHVFPVPPLALPDAQTHRDDLAGVAAVMLFVERATDHQPNFVLSAENASAVAAICRQLDGLPLAIELAAARIRLFPPAVLLQRLSNRLDLLTRGPQDLPMRQQTLQNTLDWSYNLLEPDEQALFAHLAVFVGGWTVTAADNVSADPTIPGNSVIDALQGLLDKHLIIEAPRRDDEGRFTMLETMREYARARLAQRADAPLIRQRHATYFLALAEIAIPLTQERPDSAHLAQLDAEYGNQRTALQWMLEQHDSEGSLRLCNGLAPLWDIHGHLSEGRAWLRATLALPSDEASTARADALETASRLAIEQGDWSEATELLTQALVLGRRLGDERRVAQFLRTHGWLALMQGAYADSTVLLDESLSLYRSAGDKPGISRVLGLQGQAAYEQLDFARATPLLTESITYSRAIGDAIDTAWSLNKLGLVLLHQGDLADADRLLEESLAIFRELTYTRGIAWVLGSLGWVRLAQAAYAQARELFTDSLRRYDQIGEKRNIAFILEYLACLASAQRQAERAARLFGAATALRQTAGVLLPPVVEVQYAPFLAMVRTALGTDGVVVIWAEGAALSIEQAIAYALQHDGVQDMSERQ